MAEPLAIRDLDTVELRRIAEECARQHPEPWEKGVDFVFDSNDFELGTVAESTGTEAAATFIQAFSPATVLLLLDSYEYARRAEV